MAVWRIDSGVLFLKIDFVLHVSKMQSSRKDVKCSHVEKINVLGLPIDGPQNGPAPQPWDIAVNPPAMFKNSSSRLEVPHTASVKVTLYCSNHDLYNILFVRLVTVVWEVVLKGVGSVMEEETYG